MRKPIYHILSGLTAFVVALISVAIGPVHAQTIKNTAIIEWDAGQSRVSRPSNPVELAVERPDPVQAVLSTYQLNAASGAETLAVPSPFCVGNGGTQPVMLQGVFAGTNLSPAGVEKTSRIRAGEPLIISVASPDDNRSSDIIETKMVNLSTPSGDRETIRLTESGANTGIFIGMINTAAIPPDPVSGDCRLSVHPGEFLNLSGSDAQSGRSFAAVPIEILIDPFGIVFDSGDGAPVSGARVTLISTATGLPA